ncbi:MAG TPA: hypothetical protein VF269_06330 [Rhodanobacteraceae bacterium]
MNDSRSAVFWGRFKLTLVPTVFILSFVAAWAAFQLGWMPSAKSHGKPILPQRNFTGIRIVMAGNGSQWLWRNPQRPTMTLVALSHGTCTSACVRTLVLLRNARITLGAEQDRLRLLYIGQLPTGAAGKVLLKSWYHGRDVDGKLSGFRPSHDGAVSALLVEANGTALVQYPAGFSPDGLKDDLQKVIRR